VPAWPPTSVFGDTETPLSAGDGSTARPNVSLTPAWEAVRVTEVGVVTLPAVTENVAEAEPWGTVTLDGMVTSEGDELRLMIVPPLPADELRSTVQVEPAAGLNVIGMHEKPSSVTFGTIVTIPPLLAMGRFEAPAPTAMSLMNWIWEDVFLVEVETVKETVATTPLGIGVAFNPETMQREVPALLAQVTDLPAPVATGPAAIVAAEKSAVE
jgi:hypothetical protein